MQNIGPNARWRGDQCISQSHKLHTANCILNTKYCTQKNACKNRKAVVNIQKGGIMNTGCTESFDDKEEYKIYTIETAYDSLNITFYSSNKIMCSSPFQQD